MKSNDFRIGTGYDVHRLVEGRPLILGGVNIEYPLGLDGYSDADVLLHAIGDAMLGALALGDLGKYFPDSDPQFKNADSRKLLQEINNLIYKKGFRLANADATVVAQKPKLAPYILEMRKNISADLQVDLSKISVKATTSEKLGFEGDESGISAQAVVLLNSLSDND